MAARAAKRRPRHPTTSHHRYCLRRRHGGDLISELNDDVLAHVLGFLPNATDVARACAVSRRWRHLPERLPRLHFSMLSNQGDVKQQEDVDRFVAFVNHVLATRRSGAGQRDATGGVEQLTISVELHEGCVAGVPAVHAAHADAWIRYAMQHGVKSFALKLDQPNLLPLPEQRFEDDDTDGLVLDKLPSSTRLETMALSLTYLTLPLPDNVAFDSLVDLSLQEIRLDDGDIHLLGHLLSSACCPRLQKLGLVEIVGLTELRLDAGELLELSLHRDHMFTLDLSLVELNTPKLRVFNIACYTIHTLTISAPMLEEFKSSFNWEHVGRLDVGDMPRVRILKYLDLSSDGRRVGFGDFSVRLLRRCPAVESLGVYLACTDKVVYHAEEEEEGVIDDMWRNIRQLPLVTSLTVMSSRQNEHALMSGMASLLGRCSSLRYLELNMIDFSAMTKATRPAGNQSNHLSISLPHLMEIRINGFGGTKCEARVMEWLYRSAPVLNKIKLRFDWLLSNLRHRKEYEDLLPQIPFAVLGKWAATWTHRDHGTFVWTPTYEEERYNYIS